MQNKVNPDDHPRDPAVTFPGADHLKPVPTADTQKAIEILYDALEQGAPPDVAIGFLAQQGLHLEQANALSLLQSVQKFRVNAGVGAKILAALKDMPTEITETSLGFVKQIKKPEAKS